MSDPFDTFLSQRNHPLSQKLKSSLKSLRQKLNLFRNCQVIHFHSSATLPHTLFPLSFIMAKTKKQKKRIVKRCNRVKAIQLNCASLSISPPRHSSRPNHNIVATNPCINWNNSITFRRIGNNNNMCLFQLQQTATERLS